MKILHVILGLPRTAGTTVFCVEVAKALAKLGHSVTVAIYCEPTDYDRGQLPEVVRLISIPDLIASREDFEVVHIHGLWDRDIHRAARWAYARHLPVVWSPHGNLTPWALRQRWWKKALVLLAWQWQALARAKMLHVTADCEELDVRRLGLRNRVAVVPLGVSTSLDESEIRHLKQMSRRKSGCRILLFVSRLQKKKGLLNLVRAWAQVEHTGWRVQIAGPDQEGYEAEVRAECRRLGVEDDFEFLGTVFGEAKDRLYAAADLFVLPTFSENFGAVVIESLINGTPVITTKGAPWAALEAERCGRWIELGVESLKVSLQEMLALSDSERESMGMRGRAFAERHYAWRSVASELLREYERLA